jgi:hypothetical protein
MPNEDTERQYQLISNARARAQELIGGFVSAMALREPAPVACERAVAVVDRYCSDLLADMIAALQPATPPDIAWCRSEYLTLIVEFGCAVRDAIEDSETRHAAAQGIQFQVLEHERHMRIALDSVPLAPNPPGRHYAAAPTDSW